ncbi:MULTISPECIES: hypothetical protein [unclassified Bradyrhizobium]|uniref:hypothetical protein n=1 Tax=unclassified Bradyrhizobium TaxID=2631580 RepID=UPI0028E8C017|nr:MULTISPECIES: hypothetical protein [unclassified Bradyrhizobium]
MSSSASTSAPSARVAQLSTWQVFRAPLLVGIVAAAGLIFGLFGDGLWDGLCWLGLSVPILLSLIYSAGWNFGSQPGSQDVQVDA